MPKLLDFVVHCNNASLDDIADDLTRMADPDSFDSKDELDMHFEECLGYNPMVYFDKKSIEEQFDELMVNAPYSVREQLRSKREEIIERTLECNEDIGDTVLRKVFINVIKDTIGWEPVEDTEVSLDDCISMAIFGNDDLDDSSEYEDDDLEEEDEDDLLIDEYDEESLDDD